MRTIIHIGLPGAGNGALQRLLADRRAALAKASVLFPRSPGPSNHTRLAMSARDPAHVSLLRFNRGKTSPEAQASLARQVTEGLATEIDAARPEILLLSCTQLGQMTRPSEIARLRSLLPPVARQDIRIVALAPPRPEALLRAWAAQVLEGRASTPEAELALLAEPDYWNAAARAQETHDPLRGAFSEVQGPNAWLDHAGLVRAWDTAFGAGATEIIAQDPAGWTGAEMKAALNGLLGIEVLSGAVPDWTPPPLPSAETLERARQLNELLLAVQDRRDLSLPRMTWRRILSNWEVDGPAPKAPTLAPDAPWPLPEMTGGFRASQAVLSEMFRIEKGGKEMADKRAELRTAQANAPTLPDPVETQTPEPDGLSALAASLLPPLAKEKYASLVGGAYAPHDRIGLLDETAAAPDYTPMEPRTLPKGSTGRVIVGCMKNEAPYILEWVAYHRAMGVDNFLIYTNDCSDGTDDILNRLQELGVLQHRSNDDWKGNSPQQHALNKALKEPLIEQAEWIIHIDVDEFINVRVGNGTLDDFLALVPDATNIAMTWRLFGHSGITSLEDQPVIGQFDRCAPKYCPKPHTTWGFKTMYRNTGAYAKISCHRPNKLDPDKAETVHWVNGSGRDMTKEAIKNGWRNSRASIGYDLLQLNHYALRSAESFLVKRQRGRALHVDRSIGLNYWIRMDWSDSRDITIMRNLPRMQAELNRLKSDPELARLHADGFAWHKAKAEELHGMDEFENLYREALTIKLDATERAAWSLALDLES